MTDVILEDDLFVVQDEDTEITDAPPLITFGDGNDTATASVFENTAVIATVTASDPDAGDSLIFSIAGGGDAAMFNIDAVTGSLAFIAGPDFETPRDVPSNSPNGGDNVYEVVVQATDASEAGVGTPLDDHLVGTPGNDVLSGLAGHDTLQGLDGNDTLDGGAGEDRVDYSTEGGTHAVTVNFTTGVATDTFGKTDTQPSRPSPPRRMIQATVWSIRSVVASTATCSRSSSRQEL